MSLNIAPDAGRKVITLAERFDKEHISVRLKASTAKEYRRNLQRFILPALGRLSVTGDCAAASFAWRLHQLGVGVKASPIKINLI